MKRLQVQKWCIVPFLLCAYTTNLIPGEPRAGNIQTDKTDQKLEVEPEKIVIYVPPIKVAKPKRERRESEEVIGFQNYLNTHAVIARVDDGICCILL